MWWMLLSVALAGKDAEPEPPSSMAGHFVDASNAMLSVAAGRVRQARKYSKDLASTAAAPLPVKNAAAVVADCRKEDCAAPAVADMARTCSECHLAGGRGPSPTGLEVLPGRNAAERHAWAALFLWMGLIVPEEQAWTVGLDGMVPPIDLDNQEKLIELKDAFAETVAEAKAAPDWDARADRFGDILQACGACHKKADVPIDKW